MSQEIRNKFCAQFQFYQVLNIGLKLERDLTSS
jgi:hypothetical protein